MYVHDLKVSYIVLGSSKLEEFMSRKLGRDVTGRLPNTRGLYWEDCGCAADIDNRCTRVMGGEEGLILNNGAFDVDLSVVSTVRIDKLHPNTHLMTDPPIL
jgi:hypothetical protein